MTDPRYRKPRPNDLLRRARQRIPSPSGSGRRMSRQELADAINAHIWNHHQTVERLDDNDIGKYERGEHRWPSQLRREAFRAVLQAARDADLGFHIVRGDRPSTLQHAPTGNRGEAAVAARRSGEVRPVGAERLTRLAASTAREHARAYSLAAVDGLSVDALHAEIRRLARAYATATPRELLIELVSARDSAYALIDRTRRPADLADLYLIAGQACGLAATTSWDLGDPDAADDLAEAAWTYAQLCGHNTLRAWIRSVQATIAFWSGRPAEGLGFATDGLRYAEDQAAVRLHAVAARSWSLLPHGAEQAGLALRAATEASQRGGDMSEELAGEFGFPAVRFSLCRGAVHIRLGDSAAAERSAAETLDLYRQSPGHQQRWAVRHGALIDLATARAQRGEFDGAAEALRPALALEVPRRTARLTSRLRTLRAVVTAGSGRNAPAARELVGAIDDWAAPAPDTAQRRALPPAP